MRPCWLPLCSVLDACFICWALDRDSAAVSKPEVHAAFGAVPLKPAAGVAVEQPGGGLAYGATQGAAVGVPAGDEEAQQRRPLLAGTPPSVELSAA